MKAHRKSKAMTSREAMIHAPFAQGSRYIKHDELWAMVVAELAERSLPTPEILGLNPDIGNILNVFICQLLSRKDENKEKEAGNGPFKKNRMN